MEPTDDRRAIARTAAAIYAGAVVVGVIEGFVPGGTTFSNYPGLCALIATPVTFFAGPRMPRAALFWLGPIGAALIAWALATSHGFGDGAVLYMWPVLWMAYFFDRRGAAFVVAWIGLAHAVALLLMPAGQGNADRWVDVMVSVTVVAGVTCFLAERNHRLVRELVAEARIDPLTGLLNRRGLQERMDVEITRSLRERSPVAVVMFDLDHFKEVNDAHGHEVGDRVLTWLGLLLGREARGVDAAARTGGEEFVVMMPGAGAGDARALAERVRRAVAAGDRHGERAGHGLPEGLELTISAGVAASRTPDAQGLLETADQAMYRAKRDGRDRTAVADSALSVV